MTVLYKNVPGERVLSCIPEVGDGALRATQPAALNDPFECAVLPIYVIDDEPRENAELATALTAINPNKPITPDDVLDARDAHGSLFTRQLYADQVSSRFGLVSFASDPLDPLMWSHYTVDSSGFVIGYDVEMLQDVAAKCGHLRQVTYQVGPPPITGPSVLSEPTSNLPIILAIKSSHWSYEKEWRLIAELSKTVGTAERDRHGLPINLLPIPNEAVVSVHCTERTPRERVEQISERLSDPNNRYRAGQPRRLILSQGSYGYEEAAIG